MYRWAKKDQHEREEDEAERLVRPAPKIKPPRHDRRRNTVDGFDPDVDGDPDVQRDPDLSLNYKTIGGSTLNVAARVAGVSPTAFRVALRTIFAEDAEKVRVVKRDTGTMVYINPDTLKDNPSKYEVVDPKEPAKPESQAEPDEGPAEKSLQQGHSLHEMARESGPLAGLIKDFLKPKSTAHQTLTSFSQNNANFPIQQLYPNVRFPAGVRSVGDFVDAMKAVPKAGPHKTPSKTPPPAEAPAEVPKPPASVPPAETPKAPPAEAPKPPAPAPPAEAPKAPPAEAPAPAPVPAEAPKASPAEAPNAPTPGTPPQAEAPAKAQEAPAGTAAPQPGTPPKPRPPPVQVSPKAQEIQQTIGRLTSEVDKPSPEFKAFAEGMPTGKTDAEGRQLFPNPAPTSENDRFVPFNKLPPDLQAKLADKFNEWSKAETQASALAATEMGSKARAALSNLADDGSDLSKKLNDTVREHGGDLTIQRAIPALDGVKLPAGIETVRDLQRLIKQKPLLFKERTKIEKWVEGGGADAEDFKAFAKGNADKKGGDGEPLFKDTKGKKLLPFSELSNEGKAAVYEAFQGHQRFQALQDTQEHDPALLAALQDLANPNSDLARTTSKSGKQLAIEAVPAIKAAGLPDVDTLTVEDLTRISKKLHPPVPEPKRRPYSDEERNRNLADMLMSVPVDERDMSLTLAIGAMSKLHPDDAKQAFKDYQRMRKVEMVSAADLASFVDRVKGAPVETDTDKIRPPKQGKNRKGEVVQFNQLDDDERAEVMARHRNAELARSLATKEIVGQYYKSNGAPPELASALSAALLSKQDGDPAARAEEGARKGRDMFESAIRKGVTDVEDDDYKVRDVLRSIKDPAARKMAVGYYQAADYLRAVDDFFEKGHSERTGPRRIAVGLIAASKRLKDRDSFYGKDSLFDVSRLFRERIVDRLNSLDPKKAEDVRKALQNFERAESREQRKDYEHQKREYEKARKKWEKSNKGHPYREELPPDPPPGYNADGHKPGKQLLEEHYERLGFPKTAGRVAARWFVFSSYPSRWAMAAPTPTSRTALYHGVDPYADGVDAYPAWSQAHQRDLGESDYSIILKAAREWLHQPVLAKSIEGIEKDAQYRAALDLAVRSSVDGKYDGALHPAVYNMLLAKLAGESPTVPTYVEPGLSKTAGVSYGLDQASFLFTPGRRPIPFNIDTIKAINATWVSFVDDEGTMHAVDEDGGANLSVLNTETARGALTHVDEKAGLRRETRVDVRFPLGSAADVKAAMINLGKKLGFKVEPISHTYQPGVRKAASTGDTGTMTTKFASKDANAILGRLDKLASTIQDNYETWGMPFEAARGLVNDLDKTADAIEAAAFGTDSLAKRQVETVTAARAKEAKVIQKDADEAYMNTFNTPSSPKQAESDEPYMKAYGNDDTSGVRDGKATNGKSLT